MPELSAAWVGGPGQDASPSEAADFSTRVSERINGIPGADRAVTCLGRPVVMAGDGARPRSHLDLAGGVLRRVRAPVFAWDGAALSWKTPGGTTATQAFAGTMTETTAALLAGGILACTGSGTRSLTLDGTPIAGTLIGGGSHAGDGMAYADLAATVTSTPGALDGLAIAYTSGAGAGYQGQILGYGGGALRRAWLDPAPLGAGDSTTAYSLANGDGWSLLVYTEGPDVTITATGGLALQPVPSLTLSAPFAAPTLLFRRGGNVMAWGGS